MNTNTSLLGAQSVVLRIYVIFGKVCRLLRKKQNISSLWPKLFHVYIYIYLFFFFPFNFRFSPFLCQRTKVANNPGSCEEWYLGDERDGHRHGVGTAFYTSGDVYNGQVRSVGLLGGSSSWPARQLGSYYVNSFIHHELVS